MHSWWLNTNGTSDNNNGEVGHRNECCIIKFVLKQTLRFWFSITQSKNIMKSKQLKLIFDDNIDVN